MPLAALESIDAQHAPVGAQAILAASRPSAAAPSAPITWALNVSLSGMPLSMPGAVCRSQGMRPP